MKTKTNQSKVKTILSSVAVVALFALSVAALSASPKWTSAPGLKNAATTVISTDQNEKALISQKVEAEKASAAAAEEAARQQPAPAKAAPATPRFSRPTVPGTIGGIKNIPGDYPDLSSALVDLNAQGVSAGGVTLNVLAGNPQTADAGGYVVGGAGSMVLTTSGPGATVTIEGNGNTITANGALTAGNLNDAIFKLIGADFITIDGFIMQENAANTITAAGTNNMTEWGVALLYVTTTDGCQNNTISNNTITLNRTYQNTFGIYSNSTHTATAVTVSATATGAAGGNHNLKVYGNAINNVNQGIVVVGPTAAADANTGIDIGGAGGGQANVITNYGTTGTFSGYANVSGTVNGILVRNSNGFNVSFNTVTSSVGGTTTATLNGIQIPAASNAPTGTFTNNINSNNISLQGGATGTALTGITNPSGSATTTSTLNINSNNFNTFGHTVAGATGAVTFITNVSTHKNISISSNTFTNITLSTTGSVIFISNNVQLPAAGSATADNNSIVTGFSKTGAGGTVTLHFTSTAPSSPVGSTKSEQGNNFSNITLTGATTMSGWTDLEGATGGGPTKTISGNTFSNWTCGTSTVVVIQTNFSGNNTTVSNNTISNITYAPTATGTAITGISIGSSNGGATQTVSGNTISGLSSTATGAQTIGILGGATGITTFNINNNAVSGISSTSTAGPVVAGIFNQNTGATVNIFKNSVCNVTCSPGAVIGINSTAAAATNTINIFNNLVGKLSAPTSTFFQSARGMLLQSTVAATFNVYFNSVYLDGTTPTQTYCMYIGGATVNVPNVNPRDNIFFNNVSSSNGAALPQTVYFRLGTTNATNLAATANTNLLYAGTPAADHLIYVDGAVNALTNPQQTLANYQAFVTPRENASITGDPGFVSTSCGAFDAPSVTTFLHISNASPAFHTGAPVAGITDDYDGDVRNPCTPDIGGDEVTSYSGPAIANVSIMKTADAASVAFGNQIGFKVKLTNNTANPALGLTVMDSLPSGFGVNWMIDGAMTDPGWSVSGMPPNQSLVYTPTTLAGSAMTMAHVISATTGATCGSTLNNTASFSITNGCPGTSSGMASASISVTGQPGSLDTLLSQDWESGLGAWTVASTYAGGTCPQNVKWTIQPNPYSVADGACNSSATETLNSNSGASFIVANSDRAGSGVAGNTTLTSPSFSTVGYASANLSFKHYFRPFGTSTGTVQVSTDGGGTWATVQTYSTVQGAQAAFVNAAINLNAYVGNANVQVRFVYTSAWDYYWALDDVLVTAQGTLPCPAPLTATGAVSRKTHGAMDFDVNLPLSGSPGIEPRSGGATGDYKVIFFFTPGSMVTFASAAVTAGSGMVASTMGSGTDTITVNITNVENGKVPHSNPQPQGELDTVTLMGASNGTNMGNVSVTVAVLVGDANQNGSVTGSDKALVVGQLGQPVTAANFTKDLQANGVINSNDKSIAISRRWDPLESTCRHASLSIL